MESRQNFITCIEDIEDLLSAQQISAICTSGCNDEAVKECYEDLNIKIDIDWNTTSFLIGLGFPETDLDSQRHRNECLIWVAAWNRFENE